MGDLGAGGGGRGGGGGGEGGRGGRGDKCNTVYEEEDAVRTLGTTGRVGGWEEVTRGMHEKYVVSMTQGQETTRKSG